MIEKHSWFWYALQTRGSVLPQVLPRSLICGAFGLLVSVLYHLGLPLYLPVLAGLIPNIVLGLMLVFRTNTAYERFWEGRRLWGGIIIGVRNLARQIWVGVKEKNVADHEEKIAAMHMLVAFAVATKLHLRQEDMDHELEKLITLSQYRQLKTMNNPPLEIAFWISDFLQHQRHKNALESFQHTSMQQLVNQLVEALSGCERILKTPIPLAYAIHLKQLLLIYCLSLPFQIVDLVDWWTGFVTALISFTLFGIEAIGMEIENPFGRDPNDLPLDSICATMLRNIEDIMTLTPGTRVEEPSEISIQSPV